MHLISKCCFVNRLLISDKGRMFCARYRDNEELIEAEYFAYLISTLLGIRNVPVAIPVKVHYFNKDLACLIFKCCI